MKVIVDADACPVVGIIENVCIKYSLECILYYDTSHVKYSDYSKVVIVDKGADSVDFALISVTSKGDIIVSQDYGVGCMALAKGAYAINQNGLWYTANNIDSMLEKRAFAKKLRMSSNKSHLKGPRKRTKEDDIKFEESFIKLIERVIKNDK